MPLTNKDIDRIGDKVELRMLKAFNEHREKDHKPLERRITKMKTVSDYFHVAQVSVSALIAVLKGH